LSGRVISLEEARERKTRKRKKTSAPMTARRKKKIVRNRIRLLIIAAILVVVFGVSIYKIISLNVERIKLRNEQTKLLEQKKEYKKESENVNSLEYVEKKAREDLKLVLPGEIIYSIPNGKDEKK